mgnify:FL=1|tara:strand:- start:26 stop:949 length:924 start_codon:yes stop_codon:yes gene_type:complete
MQAQVVSFEGFQSADRLKILDTVSNVDRALSDCGFIASSDLGFSDELIARVFEASATFFLSDAKNKMRSAYLSAEENFGYQAFASEHLDPASPADLKETFTMRNILNATIEENRWPSIEFKELMQFFFAECLERAFLLQRILAKALNLDEDFFVKFHSGQNISLRLLHYPACRSDKVQDSQLGAGAHTDYGLTTFLFQDSVGGLEICDQHGNWQDVEPDKSVVLINSGDLLERWTNGKYRSTLHRVKPMTRGRDRFSIAFFVDPDSDTEVKVLDSFIDADNPRKFSDVNAGDYIRGRLENSHNNLCE